MYRARTRKSSNRDRILECIFRNAPISRTSISEMTEITPATTTTTVALLLEDGVLVELGEEQCVDNNNIGRKRIALGINPAYTCAVGVEFNQKSMHACITDLAGTVIRQRMVAYSPTLSDNITAVIISEIRTLIQSADIETSHICGIGIAVPGHMDEHQQKMISNHTVWDDFDALKIQQAFPLLPLVLENNARCMALGQYLFHPHNSPSNFAFFHVGLGMFCANIIDDELFLGNAYVSGEIGHTIVAPDGQRCECGKHGCLQTIASERWLLENARRLYDFDGRSLLQHLVDSKEDLTIEHVATAYAMGDAAMGRYVANALKYLGIATSNIAIIMNPEKIFLHGQMFNYPEIHTELMEIINNQLLFVGNNYVNTVEIIPYFPVDGAIGATALAVIRCLLNIVP